MPESRRYAAWLDLVADLARHHAGPFPRVVVADQLYETFGCHVSWNWMDEDGRFGFEMQQTAQGFPSAAAVDWWLDEGVRCHPLIYWYVRTRDPLPTTTGRVVGRLESPRAFGMVNELLAPYGWEQQLSISYALGSSHYRALVLSRGRDDFTDEELDLARRLQPLFAVLERQSAALQPGPAYPAAGLTARELAVLRLLREGLTAVAIGHRLMISPRTVHAHLGSLYRKLGVTDRMRAVLVADEAGLAPRGTQAVVSDIDTPGLRHRWTAPRPARPQPVLPGAERARQE